MCCCKGDELRDQHNESIKFKCRASKIYGESVLDYSIFKNKSFGELKDIDSEINKKVKIPIVSDKICVFGRHKEIRQALEFLNYQDKNKRILIFKGTSGSSFE